MRNALPVGVALLFALAGAGCSSGAAGAPVDGGASPSDSGGGSVSADDGGPAVGAACAKDTDCLTGEKCSNDAYPNGNPLYPTPICLAACIPATSASQGIAPCGPNTIPGAGLCQPASASASASTSGLCVPFCVVTPSGQVTGCLGNDACELLTGTEPDPIDPTQLDGAGWCQPGCTENSQCPAGSTCDPLQAACLKVPFAATLPIGAVCSLSASAAQCNCVAAAGQTTGFCSATCITGTSVCPEPTADGGASPSPEAGAVDAGGGAPARAPWVCSAQTNVTAIEDDGGAIFTLQPAGLWGLCTPACKTNADCAGVQGHCSQGDPAAPTGFTGTCAAGL